MSRCRKRHSASLRRRRRRDHGSDRAGAIGRRRECRRNQRSGTNSAPRRSIQVSQGKCRDAADVNASCHRGATPLREAAQNGHKDVVVELLAHGARVDALRKTKTALIQQRGGSPNNNTFDLLLQRRSVDVSSLEGNTPLHLAAANATNEEVVEVMLVSGADVDATNAQGWTPLQLEVQESERRRDQAAEARSGPKHHRWRTNTASRRCRSRKHGRAGGAFDVRSRCRGRAWERCDSIASCQPFQALATRGRAAGVQLASE